MIKYVGVYLLSGLIITYGYAFLMCYWTWKHVGEDRFSDAMRHLMSLKVKLYKDTDNKTVSGFISWYESLSEKALLAYLAFSLLIWPMAVVENAATLSDHIKYVHEIEGKSN